MNTILHSDSLLLSYQIKSNFDLTKLLIRQLWGDGTSYEELHESVRNFPDELKEPHFREHLSFKVRLHGLGMKV